MVLYILTGDNFNLTRKIHHYVICSVSKLKWGIMFCLINSVIAVNKNVNFRWQIQNFLKKLTQTLESWDKWHRVAEASDLNGGNVLKFPAELQAEQAAEVAAILPLCHAMKSKLPALPHQPGLCVD